MMNIKFYYIVIPLFLLSTSLPAATFNINTPKSTLSFKADAFFNDVSGRFDNWDGTINVDLDKPLKGTVKVVVKTSSINTKSSVRDNHLRGRSFFYVKKFPELSFTSTSITPIPNKPDYYNVAGILTIRDITKEITFPAEILVRSDKIFANAEFIILRKDFDISYRSALNPIKNEVAIRFSIVAEEF